MPQSTPYLVIDPTIKASVLSTMATHLGRDLDRPPVMCDGGGTFYVETEAERILLDTVQGSVTRIVDLPGLGCVAEEWFFGERVAGGKA